MYAEYKWIMGLLHVKSTPDGVWSLVKDHKVIREVVLDEAAKVVREMVRYATAGLPGTARGSEKAGYNRALDEAEPYILALKEKTGG